MDDLRAMKEQAEAIYRLISAGYGDADRKSIRAGELSGTIQRLIWELERGTLRAATVAVNDRSNSILTDSQHDSSV
jgi:hypothetical protein